MSWLFPIRGDKPEQTQGRQISLADVQKQAKEGGSLLVINVSYLHDLWLETRMTQLLNH